MNLLNLIKSDLKTPKSEIKEKHYDLHALLGIGIFLSIYSFTIPVIVKVVLGVLMAFVIGFLIEFVQNVILDAEADSKDYRFTTYGAVLAIPLAFVLNAIIEEWYYFLIVGIGIILYSWITRRKRQINKK